jgi:hypothetical protein
MASSDDDFKLTRRTLATSRVIAKGRGIRDVNRLVRAYGGTHAGWTKKSTAVFYRDRRPWEYHWYEHPGIGRVETKLIDVQARRAR